MADDHVVGFELDGVARDAHAVARRGVAGKSDVRRADTNLFLQMDDAGDVKHDDARAAGFERFPKRAGPAIFQARHNDGASPAPTEAICAAALGAGKGGDVRLRQVAGLGRIGKVRLALLGPFLNRGQCALPGLVGMTIHFGILSPLLRRDFGGNRRILR